MSAIIDAELEIRRILNVPVVTTSGFLSFLDVHHKDDVIHTTTMFILRSSNSRSYDALLLRMKATRETFRKMYIFNPRTIEQRFMITKLLESTHDSIDTIESLMVRTIYPTHPPSTVTNLSHMFTPTGIFSVARNQNVAEKYSYVSKCSVNLLKTIPIICIIPTTTASNTLDFHPDNSIKTLSFCIHYRGNVFYRHMYVKDPTNPIDYTHDGYPTAQDPVIYIACKSERELLERFINDYISSGVLKLVGLRTDCIHYLCGGAVKETIIYILDRMFFLGISKVIPYIYEKSGILSFGKYCIVVDIPNRRIETMNWYEKLYDDIIEQHRPPTLKIKKREKTRSWCKRQLYMKPSAVNRYRQYSDSSKIEYNTLFGNLFYILII